MSARAAKSAAGLLISLGLLTTWLVVGYSATQKMLKDGEQFASPLALPNIGEDFVTLPDTALDEQAHLKKLPAMSNLDLAMLVIAVQKEAGNQGARGMMIVSASILNRVGSYCLTVAICIQAPKQYSFIEQNKIQNLIRGVSQNAIFAETQKPEYLAAKRAITAIMVDNRYYRDYALGTRFYMNPKYSSKAGLNWFAKSASAVFRYRDHIFFKEKGK